MFLFPRTREMSQRPRLNMLQVCNRKQPGKPDRTQTRHTQDSPTAFNPSPTALSCGEAGREYLPSIQTAAQLKFTLQFVALSK